MTIENLIEILSVAGAVLLLVIKRKDMKKYIPAGLLALVWGVVWCEFAEYFHWWKYTSRVFPYFDMSASATFVVVPIMAMFWIRYAPSGIVRLLIWGLLSTSFLTGTEYILEKYTDVLEYGNGYSWHYSFLIWFVSWYAWYGFYLWFYKGIRET